MGPTRVPNGKLGRREGIQDAMDERAHRSRPRMGLRDRARTRWLGTERNTIAASTDPRSRTGRGGRNDRRSARRHLRRSHRRRPGTDARRDYNRCAATDGQTRRRDEYGDGGQGGRKKKAQAHHSSPSKALSTASHRQ